MQLSEFIPKCLNSNAIVSPDASRSFVLISKAGLSLSSQDFYELNNFAKTLRGSYHSMNGEYPGCFVFNRKDSDNALAFFENYYNKFVKRIVDEKLPSFRVEPEPTRSDIQNVYDANRLTGQGHPILAYHDEDGFRTPLLNASVPMMPSERIKGTWKDNGDNKVYFSFESYQDLSNFLHLTREMHVEKIYPDVTPRYVAATVQPVAQKVEKQDEPKQEAPRKRVMPTGKVVQPSLFDQDELDRLNTNPKQNKDNIKNDEPRNLHTDDGPVDESVSTARPLHKPAVEGGDSPAERHASPRGKQPADAGGDGGNSQGNEHTDTKPAQPSGRRSGGDSSADTGDSLADGAQPLGRDDHAADSREQSGAGRGDGPVAGPVGEPAVLPDGTETQPADGQQGPGGDAGKGDDNTGILPVTEEDRVEVEEENQVPQNPNAFIFDEHPDVELPKAGTQKAMNANIEALEVLDTLLKEKRQATQEEQEKLAMYSGWGSSPLRFSDIQYVRFNNDAERENSYRVVGLVESICRSTQGMTGSELDKFGLTEPLHAESVEYELDKSRKTAYYTDDAITKSMLGLVDKFGAKGNFLEPGSGVGQMLSAFSREQMDRFNITAVELEPLSAMINKQLHPDIEMRVGGFEKQQDLGKFDVSFCNIPFGDAKINDNMFNVLRHTDPAYESCQQFLHTYFPLKMDDRTKEGGLCIILSSNGLLDAPSFADTRRLLSRHADFVGAVRLPDNTFSNAQVNTDIIVLRQKKKGDLSVSENFVPSVPLPLLDNDGNRIFKERIKVDFTPETVEKYQLDVDKVCEEFGLKPEDMFLTKDKKKIEVDDYLTYNTNIYFIEHPDHVVGSPVTRSREFGPEFFTTSQLSPKEIAQKVTDILGPICDKYIQQVNPTFSESARESQKEEPSTTKSVKEQEFEAIAVAFNDLYKSSMDGAGEDLLKQKRDQLNYAYDVFNLRYGYINDNKDLRQNVNYSMLSALEVEDGKVSKMRSRYQKADVFFKNTFQRNTVKFDAGNPQDVINYSMQHYGRVDTRLLGKNLGEDWEEKTKGLIFRDPVNNEYTPKNLYLSGDVKTKLAIAEAAVLNDASFQENVTALRDIQPKDLAFGDIKATLGSNYIPVEYFREYISEVVLNSPYESKGNFNILDCNVSVTDPYIVQMGAKYSSSQMPDLSFGSATPSRIISASLNDRYIECTKRDENNKSIPDEKNTLLANTKVKEIRNGFQLWLLDPKNADKCSVIAKNYNETFNRYVKTEYSADFVNPEGCSKTLREHQAKAVTRILTGDDVLLDHSVGAGKSLVMFSAIMENRRRGLANKQLLLCPTATYMQVAKEFQREFPSAKLLYPDKDEFTCPKRKPGETDDQYEQVCRNSPLNRFLTRIKTTDSDCVIMTHDQYARLSHSPEIQAEILSQRLAEYGQAIFLTQGDRDSKRIHDKMVSEHQKLEERIDKLMNRQNDMPFITFEEIGFDKLFVDEAHKFKNLAYMTNKNNVLGLGSREGSDRAEKMLFGVRHIQKVNGGDKGVVFATGTPLTNSVAELFNYFNYLKPSLLKAQKHECFDAWGGNFCEFITKGEVKSSLKIAAVTRPRAWKNVAELQTNIAVMSDHVDVSNVSSIRRPTPNLHLETIEFDSKVDKKVIEEARNMLETGHSDYLGIHLDDKQISAASLVAGDVLNKLAINSELLPIPDKSAHNKVDKVVENVLDIYEKTAERKGTQLIFCDTIESKPKAEEEKKTKKGEPGDEDGRDKDVSVDDVSKTEADNEALKKLGDSVTYTQYNVYRDIKQKLIDGGIPENEVAIIRDYSKAEQKEIFEKIRQGEIRVAIGSTSVLGTGVNVQDKIVAMHHPDVPWTPADLEQRNGRGIRQGNENSEVDIYYYIKKNSMDGRKYDIVNTKNEINKQIMSGDATQRHIEFKDDSSKDLIKQAMEVGIGNPYYMKAQELYQEKTDLEQMIAAKQTTLAINEATIREANAMKNVFSSDMKKLNAEIAYASRNGWVGKADEGTKNSTTVKVNSTLYEDAPKKAGLAMLEELDKGKQVKIEAFGYEAKLSRHPEYRTKYLFSVTARTGETDGIAGLDKDTLKKMFVLHDVVKAPEKKVEGPSLFSDKDLAQAPTAKDEQAKKQQERYDNLALQLGMSFRNVILSVEKSSLAVQNQFGHQQETINRVSKNIEPLTEEITAMSAEHREKADLHKVYDAIATGKNNFDTGFYAFISKEWNGKAPDSPLHENFADFPTKDIYAQPVGQGFQWLDENKDLLFSKYLDLVETESGIKNASNDELYPMREMPIEVAGEERNLSVAGPIILDQERLKVLLEPIADKVEPHQMERLADRLADHFERQLLPALDRMNENRGEDVQPLVVAIVHAPDHCGRERVVDPNDKELSSYTGSLHSEASLIVARSANAMSDFEPATQFRVRDVVVTAELQTAIAGFAQKSYDAGRMQDTPQRFLDSFSNYNRLLLGDKKETLHLHLSEEFEDGVAKTKVEPLQAPYAYRPEKMMEDTIGSLTRLSRLAEKYTEQEQGRDSYNAGLTQEMSSFSREVINKSNTEDLTRKICTLSPVNTGDEKVAPLDEKTLLDLKSLTIADLVNAPTRDDKVHLMYQSETGRVVPDPFHYAASDDHLPSNLYVSGHRCQVIDVTIDKQELRQLLQENPAVQRDLEIWHKPENAKVDFSAYAKNNIGVDFHMLSSQDLKDRTTIIANADNLIVGRVDFANAHTSPTHISYDAKIGKNDLLTNQFGMPSVAPLTLVSHKQEADKPVVTLGPLPLPVVGHVGFNKRMEAEDIHLLGSVSKNMMVSGIAPSVTVSGMSILKSDIERNAVKLQVPAIPITERNHYLGNEINEHDRALLQGGPLKQLDHPLPVTDLGGKAFNALLRMEETGKPVVVPAQDIKVPGFIASQLHQPDVEKVQNGYPLQVENLEVQGRRLNGYLLSDPLTKDINIHRNDPFETKEAVKVSEQEGQTAPAHQQGDFIKPDASGDEAKNGQNRHL